MKPPNSTKSAVYQWHAALTDLFEQLGEWRGELLSSPSPPQSLWRYDHYRVTTILQDDGYQTASVGIIIISVVVMGFHCRHFRRHYLRAQIQWYLAYSLPTLLNPSPSVARVIAFISIAVAAVVVVVMSVRLFIFYLFVPVQRRYTPDTRRSCRPSTTRSCSSAWSTSSGLRYGACPAVGVKLDQTSPGLVRVLESMPRPEEQRECAQSLTKVRVRVNSLTFRPALNTTIWPLWSGNCPVSRTISTAG